ncbi:MAG: hypothetical protein AAGB31_03140 [Bdellovibrio sp.]
MSFFVVLMTMMGFAQAAEQEVCPYAVERREGTQIQQLWSEETKTCFFSITPLDGYKELIYRDHLLTSQGLFMVFNSFGPGDESVTTGAREFYMFPRKEKQFSHTWNDETRELIITHVTGDVFTFDSQKAELKSIGQAQVKVADKVDPKNRGGVEISQYPGLLLDGGFKLGSSPTGVSTAQSTMKDVLGNTCSVKNSELFRYPAGGDIIFRYTDKALGAFLKKRCPQLKASPL